VTRVDLIMVAGHWAGCFEIPRGS